MNGEPIQLRLFVALLVPDAVKQKLHAAQQKLRDALGSRTANWTRPEQFHLTIKFLGNVDATRLDTLAESLKKACYGLVPSDIEARDAGFFPDSKRPRVIWIGVRAPEEWLFRLHSTVETVCAPFATAKPENRFHAHVTLGRVKQAGKSDADAMRSWAEKWAGCGFGKWRAEEVALVRSRLSPSGAAYSKECLARLGPGGTP